MIRYVVLGSIVNIIEKSSTNKTSLLFGDSSGSWFRVASENCTLQINPIKLHGNNYLAWFQTCLLFIKARGLYGYIASEKRVQ